MNFKFLSILQIGLLIFCWALTIAIAGETMGYKSIKDVPLEKWQELSAKKIYFGHQSVGFNIIDGIEQLMKEYPQIKLKIVESRHLEKDNGVFVHSRVGENREPETKINDFVNVIDQELGVVPDMAALKFCYVDAYDKVDVNKVFQQYKDAMDRLKKEHPDMTIIHFTMPLRTQPITWKTKAKLLLGKEPWELLDNIKRNQFNKLLLQEYLGKEPVFDIARIESTDKDGNSLDITVGENEYLVMRPEYSSDGGHLNSKGERWVAENFLLFLVNAM